MAAGGEIARLKAAQEEALGKIRVARAGAWA
jgi:hypothetical protein